MTEKINYHGDDLILTARAARVIDETKAKKRGLLAFAQREGHMIDVDKKFDKDDKKKTTAAQKNEMIIEMGTQQIEMHTHQSEIERIKISQAATDLMEFVLANEAKDPLIIGAAPRDNPWLNQIRWSDVLGKSERFAARD